MLLNLFIADNSSRAAQSGTPQLTHFTHRQCKIQKKAYWFIDSRGTPSIPWSTVKQLLPVSLKEKPFLMQYFFANSSWCNMFICSTIRDALLFRIYFKCQKRWSHHTPLLHVVLERVVEIWGHGKNKYDTREIIKAMLVILTVIILLL